MSWRSNFAFFLEYFPHGSDPARWRIQGEERGEKGKIKRGDGQGAEVNTVGGGGDGDKQRRRRDSRDEVE
jgi:hypothetical protein